MTFRAAPPASSYDDVCWLDAVSDEEIAERARWADGPDDDPEPAEPTASELLDDLEATGPGAWAAAVLPMVAELTLTRLDQQRLLEAWQRQASWAEAGSLATAARIVGPEREPDGTSRDDDDREDIALALGQSFGAAQRRIDLARALVFRFAIALAELAAGRITYLHALTLAELTADLTDEQARAVEAMVLPCNAPPLNVFRGDVRKAVLKVAPKDADERHETAKKGRRMQLHPDADGMANLWMHLPAQDALELWNRVTALAQRMVREDATKTLTVEAARVDALMAITRGAADGDALPTRLKRRQLIGLVIDLDTWLGLRDDPAFLPGYGPVAPGQARQIAEQLGRVRRIITSPLTGEVLHYDRTTYEVPAALDEFVQVRDGECCFPGCTRPGIWCDDDHRRPWADGGETNPENIWLLCPRHHDLKTRGIWSVVLNADGSPTWTGPSGRTYTTRPPKPLGD